MELLIVSVTLK